MSFMKHDYTDAIVELTVDECEEVNAGILPVLAYAGASIIMTAIQVGFVDGVFSGIAKQANSRG